MNEGQIRDTVSNEKTSDGWLVTVTEDGVVTHKRLFSDKEQAVAFESAQKQRIFYR
jgi:hypothetical protein